VVGEKKKGKERGKKGEGHGGPKGAFFGKWKEECQ